MGNLFVKFTPCIDTPPHFCLFCLCLNKKRRSNMKKLLAVLAIAGSLLLAPLHADEPLYTDWVWLNGGWVYTGTLNPPPLPPPNPPTGK